MRDTLAEACPQEEVRAMVRTVMEEVCGVPPYKLLAGDDRPLRLREQRRLEHITKRLCAHEPLAYVLGTAHFFGLRLKVGRSVLIPRPETEELVEHILMRSEGAAADMLDVGTGSGCIACALALRWPASRVTVIDVSARALSVARRNAAAAGVAIRFVQADLLKERSMAAALGEASFDVVVSNPPYVRESERATMSPNVLDYEPWRALFVPDGKPLLFYEALVRLSQRRLRPQGMLYVEINESLGRETADLMCRAGMREVELLKDIRGRDRFIQARR
jgi:release factor glutamine methyltransferase